MDWALFASRFYLWPEHTLLPQEVTPAALLLDFMDIYQGWLQVEDAL